ncbi:MAG TPA: VanZ family protein [Thermoanaerobaculia bacterium]|nr:VanZ family protein [Thermoanaerobaculia bacterium]
MLFSAGAGRLFDGRLTSSRFEPILRCIPVVVYLLAIFSVSSIPGKEIHLVVSDKLAHFTEYFILAVLLTFAAAGLSRSRVTHWHFLACWFFAAMYAASDEIHQGFVPNRDSSILDWTADAFGAAAALILISMAVRQLRATQ